MSSANIISGEIDEGVDPTFFGLVVSPDGTPLVTSDVVANGIVMNIFDLSGSTTATSMFTQTLNPSDSVNGYQILSSSLQTTGWTKSGDGYNFRYLFAISSVAGGLVGGRTYRFEFVFKLTNSTTPALGTGNSKQLYELIVRPTYS